MTIVLSVPQWQGSAVPTAPRLVSGARRAADLVPADSVVTVPTGDGAVDIVDGVRALHTLVGNQRQIGAALAQLDDFVLIIGGECSVDVLPIAAIAERYGDALTVLWIDAHPDVYGPGQLKTGAFHAMGVRTLLGDGPPALTPSWTLAPGQVILAGERAGGASEHEYIRKTGLRRYGVVDLEEAFAAVIGPVYVHVDLDVLDPTEFASVGYPEPDGVRSQQLVDLISGLGNVVGAAITEYAPVADDPSELAVIRRLAAAMTRGQA
ncbi:arginase family protein [Fodinicola feengrottensis]|uniref:Arginase family protein n=1 Tax=Fodinicola feengrottensis TaxID=435914 RepID=A0ABN2GJL9_9ACTN